LEPRRISTREFCRRSADLLNELERERRPFVITRYGRPAAVLGPVPEGAAGGELLQIGSGEVDAPDSEPEPELDPEQRETLLALARGETLTGVRERVLLVQLELQGLSAKGWTGYRVTPSGARLAATLRT
jgi:hypothetical protein